ncbi:hypothetical protein cypCar_00031492, partial [Cyprinus carpio]
ERREQELHEAYWNARTPEEAASVLQRYAQRFTISEAVIERLKLPKLLERSVSADPTRHSSLPVSPDILFSLSASSNPLQYLRQQSLPLVKFTSTVEARVTGYSTEHEFVGDVTVPSLRPKPYSSAAAEMRTAKVDEIMRLNGERENVGHSNKGGPQKNKEAEDDSLKFFPSSYQHTDSDITDMSDVSGVQPTDHTLSSMCTQECCEKDTDTTEVEGGTVPQVGDVTISPEVLELKAEKIDQEQTDETYISDSQQDMIQFDNSAVQVYKLATETPQKSTNQSEPSNLESYRTKPVLNLVKRGEHFSWDPEEERKRQERWRQEQERKLQEKYQREKEKLKQEWEQAQKEVEEEERRADYEFMNGLRGRTDSEFMSGLHGCDRIDIEFMNGQHGPDWTDREFMNCLLGHDRADNEFMSGFYGFDKADSEFMNDLLGHDRTDREIRSGCRHLWMFCSGHPPPLDVLQWTPLPLEFLQQTLPPMEALEVIAGNERPLGQTH